MSTLSGKHTLRVEAERPTASTLLLCKLPMDPELTHNRTAETVRGMTRVFVTVATTLRESPFRTWRLIGQRFRLIVLLLPRLDVLVYADMNSELTSHFLGYSRLAKVQAVFWGNPITTGET